MLKAQSTKIAEPIPVEFEQVFVAYGWQRANRIFGKRATKRYFTALGADRLHEMRVDHLKMTKLAAEAKTP